MTAPPIVTADKKNLLALVRTACYELALPAPQTVIGSTDKQVSQLLALANREGKEFYNKAHRLGGWQELRSEHTFATVGVGPFTGNLTTGLFTVTNLSSTTGITTGMVAVSPYIPVTARVVSIDSPTQVTLDVAATSTATAASVSFGQDHYSLPSDFAYMMTKTEWDRSFRWQMLGPLEAQEWQVLWSGISPVGPRMRFRIMNNYYYVQPAPTSTHNLVYEYYSNAWCQSSTGTAQASWKADTDYYSLDDEVFIMGLKWRFLAAKKLDYTQEKNDYEMLTERLMARNGANRDLPLNAQAAQLRLLSTANIPDTGFGG